MKSPHPPATPAWTTYLQQFHAERPGITERILTRCHAHGLDPHEWCAQPLADHDGQIPDLACGSADEVLASLHLPNVDPARLAAGRRVLEGSVGDELTVPLRRIVLDRPGASA